MGTLHGAILGEVADAAMGTGLASRLGDRESFTTVQLKRNFLQPFWTGGLVATDDAPLWIESLDRSGADH